MVQQTEASGAGAAIVPLRRYQLDVSQRTLQRLEELARLMETSPEVALQMAVANTLNTVQRGLAIYPRPMLEPGSDGHNGDPLDV